MNKNFPCRGNSPANRFPSKAFWYCTVTGWGIYGLLDAASVYLHNGDFLAQLPHSLLVSCLGILCGFGYRYGAHQFRVHFHNPLKLIPLAVVLAIILGYVLTLADYVLLRGQAALDIMSGLITRSDNNWWFPFVISQWIGTSYALLIWLLLFNFIQAERYDTQPRKASIWVAVVALAAFYLFNEFFHALVVIAYYNPEGFLFSADFFINNMLILLTGAACAALVLLLKAQYPVVGSYLLPLLPGLGFLVFCTSFFGMVIFRLLFSMEILQQHSLAELPQAIASVFTSPGQLWSSKNEFIGTLRSQLDLQAVIVLLFMYFRYPNGYFSRQHPEIIFDIKNIVQFWVYNISGWSVLGCYLYFSDLLSWQSVSNDFARTMLVTLVVGGVFVGLFMRSLIRRFRLLDKSLARFSVLMLLLSLVFGLLLAGSLWLMGYISVFAGDAVMQLQAYEQLVRGGDFFIPLIAVTSAGCWIWVMVYEKTVTQRIKVKQQLTQLQMERNLKELQLNQLAGKVDPHFIFNALNNIRALIREDADKAREAIVVLSKILRMPLASNANKIPLADEVDLVRNYIHLCKIQLEERLLFAEHIAPELTRALIPPMCLQILTENAIKHGISQLPDGGELILSVSASQGELICTLTNSGRLESSGVQPGFGVGLNSIRERLQLLYGEQASFSLHENDQRVLATLRLPLEYAP